VAGSWRSLNNEQHPPNTVRVIKSRIRNVHRMLVKKAKVKERKTWKT
jgi:hypothetical protein